MKDLEEQCICVELCLKLTETFTEAFQVLKQADGEDCSRIQCHEWHQRFKSGRTSIEDDPNTGRPSTSMDIIREIPALTVREVSEEVGNSKRSCHPISTQKLGMHRICSHVALRP
jgi:hypothetical protein